MRLFTSFCGTFRCLIREHRKKKETIFEQAERGNPSAMFKLAKLYDCNAISSTSDSEYVYWLKRFMESSQVRSIIEQYDDEEGKLQNDSFNFEEEYSLYPMIIEAGIALGLYYGNSSNIHEVEFAQQALNDAWVVSRFDYIEVDGEDDVTDILSLLNRAKDRTTLLSGGAD